jgi:hypothetical protein
MCRLTRPCHPYQCRATCVCVHMCVSLHVHTGSPFGHASASMQLLLASRPTSHHHRIDRWWCARIYFIVDSCADSSPRTTTPTHFAKSLRGPSYVTLDRVISCPTALPSITNTQHHSLAAISKHAKINTTNSLVPNGVTHTPIMKPRFAESARVCLYFHTEAARFTSQTARPCIVRDC